MRSRFFPLRCTALLTSLLVCGCTTVESDGETTTLSYNWLTIASTALLGILCIGVSILLATAPRRTIRKYVRAAVFGCVGLILLFVLPVPFAWYKVEVNSEAILLREFPNSVRIPRDNVESINVIPGRSDPRIRLATNSGEVYYINQSEIGEASFDTMRISLVNFIRPVADDKRPLQQ